MDHTLNMESQCFVPIDTSFSFASSPDAPVTPTSSPRSDWMESVPLDYSDVYNNAYYWTNTTCPASSFMSDSTCSETVRGGLPYQHVLHQQYVDIDYQQLPYTSEVDISPVGPISPFPMPTTPGTGDNYFTVGTIMSPQALSRSGSIASMPSLSCSSDSPLSIVSERRVSDVSSCLDQDPYPLSVCPLRDSRSIYDAESPPETHNLADETPMSLQRKAPKSRKQTIETSAFRATIIKKATGACDYPGCNKAFRRIEHLKRHKQTSHGEGENSFVCEFCGKDQFNRYDNLQTHRRLHARHNKRYRSIKFVPAAVDIIAEEDRTRKRRVTYRSKGMAVQDWRVHG
ncbi:zinc finger C2H2-type integrase DNA-binding protein [Fusarium subglutinans]|uniref:Zinc finger C2H2-type integrase DNA-binding protein n=1 Tax=Gibberella subglutinans TaxID=42677 RepID=A0A8H5Q9E8_GIBSU|nr:zinc finger C2H2-type integrase DNA-binding protein [Fusarium subglutinans]KAF5611621.1 zinc finger C2H2-type integrase DNA-binding protein [Fusarium subglutinans]